MNELVWLIEWLAWRLPRELLSRQGVHLRRMWGALRGNAKPLMLCNIFWTIPSNFMAIYLQLFMVEQGLSKIEIGTVASAQIVAQMCGALVGGFLAERFGRLRTVTLVDALCWPLAYLVFSSAHGYLSFLVGSILVGAVFTLSPAWTSLYVEGVPAGKRMHLFGLLQMPWFVGSIIASSSGFLVRSWGISASSRVVFGGACALTAFSVWLRSRYLKDPSPPRREFRPSLADIEGVARCHWAAFRSILARRQLAGMFLVQILMTIFLAVSATYNFVYFADHRGAAIPPATLAVLPLVGGITVLVTTLVVVPLVSLSSVGRFFMSSLALMTASSVIFLFAHDGSLGLVLAGTVAGGLGFGIFNPSLNGYWSNMMGDRERPRILAFTTVAGMLVTIPAPTIAGALYAIRPVGPLLMQIACYLLAGACFLAVVRRPGKRVI